MWRKTTFFSQSNYMSQSVKILCMKSMFPIIIKKCKKNVFHPLLIGWYGYFLWYYFRILAKMSLTIIILWNAVNPSTCIVSKACDIYLQKINLLWNISQKFHRTPSKLKQYNYDLVKENDCNDKQQKVTNDRGCYCAGSSSRWVTHVSHHRCFPW